MQLPQKRHGMNCLQLFVQKQTLSILANQHADRCRRHPVTGQSESCEA